MEAGGDVQPTVQHQVHALEADHVAWLVWVAAETRLKNISTRCPVGIGDEIAIVYNDGEKNLTRGDDEKVAVEESSKDLVLAEATGLTVASLVPFDAIDPDID